MRWSTSILLVGLWISPLVAQPVAAVGGSPLEPAGTGGLQVVDEALLKLSSHRRLLVVGAHPDDEDTTLLAFVSVGLGGDAAYLSLSRGEGGQNLIGAELGTGLGLIRTGELMAARRIEGTRQYFTRAYDFGYTRSLTETFERWPRAILLEDAVRAVRRFKPQVVVAVFPGNGRAGHGQHQASGVIAEDLFEQAGIPDRFPALTAAGLPPWQPDALYRRVWRNREEATLEFPLAAIDPWSGRSVLQIAGASRSMHRSQDMGTLQRLGSRKGGLIAVAGEVTTEAQEVFGGIDTDLTAIAALLPEGVLRERVRDGLTRVAALAIGSRTVLSPSRMGATVEALAGIVDSLDTLLGTVANAEGVQSASIVADLLEEKREAACIALAAASGVAVDAVSDRETVALGGSLKVTATVWDSGEQAVEIDAVRLRSQAGWEVAPQAEVEQDQGVTGLEQWGYEVQVPATAEPTRPYFLQLPLDRDLYVWDAAKDPDLGEPIQREPLTAIFEMTISGAPIRLEREVVYRFRDQAHGEVRRPVRALPAIEVSATPGLLVWRRGAARVRQIEVMVTSHAEGPLAGRLEITGGEGVWPLMPTLPFQIEETAGQQLVKVELATPERAPAGRVELEVVATTADGRKHTTAYPLVSYPHIRPLTQPIPAQVDVQFLDLDLPDVAAVGYVRGASDRVPEVLREIGLPIQMLTDEDLRGADLSIFDALVVGSRAYETNPTLAEVNHRLLGFAEQGGLLVVQYQQYQFVRGGFAPLGMEIGRPHGRVTDETAAVEILDSDHPVFQTPNRITEEDWSGWVQERGLYFPSEWDAGYASLLLLHDEGQPPERGALLIADVGQGTYVYTGLSFFRQLPAGVPGAIRLFVNLLSLERS